ncbi:MAG: SDR family NAD(P)-dependent oxidoreductase [Thermodesulfobacteriota bacterium]
MDLGFSGKTVIVSGGASNIGRAVCHAFAEEGANVVIADWDEKQAEKVVNAIVEKGGKAIAHKVDVTDPDQVQGMVNKTLEKFGQIDVLVNSVGGNADDYFLKETREKWQKTVNMNLWGMINCTRAVLDHMVERKSGSVVSVGSDAGRVGEFKEGIYSACKAGIMALSKTLARELGRHGLRFNIVCPGLTPPTSEDIGEKSHWQAQLSTFTPEVLEKAAKVYPLRKLGKPEDTANAILFLASGRAGHITGQTLSVSGGYTMI